MSTRLPSSPTPKNFAKAVRKHQVDPALKRIAGKDKRLTRASLKRAKAAGELKSEAMASAVDNIERFFDREHTKKPMVATVAQSIEDNAERIAHRAAGTDHRLSAADVEADFPAYLKDNYENLRPSSKVKTGARAKTSAKASEPGSAPAKPKMKTKAKPSTTSETAQPRGGGNATPVVEALSPAPSATPLGEVTLAQVKKAAKLLKQLVAQIDNGDATLTQNEAHRAMGYTMRYSSVIAGPGAKVDDATRSALIAEINKMKSKADRSVAGIQSGVDQAVVEIELASARGPSLDPGVNKKVKSSLAKCLVQFAAAHASHKASDFHFIDDSASVYVPRTPFRPRAGASAAELVEDLLAHFNSYSNDNSMHGPRPQSITRYVLGTIETQGILGAVEALPEATARGVLAELSRRVLQADALGTDALRRIYIEPAAVAPVEALAERLGVQASFRGNPVAPQFDYY